MGNFISPTLMSGIATITEFCKLHYELQSIGYDILEQQLVKFLFNGCKSVYKNAGGKMVGWKSLP